MRRMLLIALLGLAACSRQAESPSTDTARQSRPTPVAPAPAAPAIIFRSSTGALDACSLISPDDLKRITGQAFKAGVNTTHEADLMRCTFPRVEGGGINLTLHLKDVTADYRAMAGMAPVPGFADEAWWSPVVTTFVDRKGSHVLAVGFNFSGGDQKKWAEEIVLEILPKL